MNETKFTVVISDYNNYDSYVCRYNSLYEMLQDLFFDEVPDIPAVTKEDILRDAKYLMEKTLERYTFNALYIEDNMIKEFDFKFLSDDDIIKSYLLAYE